MKFDFKLKTKGLNSLRPINNDLDSTEDADSVTDESSIFDSIPTNNSISVISEDIEEKKTFSRPMSCYTTPPLSNESLAYKTLEIIPNRDLRRKSSWIGRPVSISLKKKEDIYKKKTDNVNNAKDLDYISINNEARRYEFCQNVGKEHRPTGEQIIMEDTDMTTLDSGTLEDDSFTSTSSSFHSENFSNISCSTIQSNNKIPKTATKRPDINRNAIRNRLSFLQPISSSMKIKIYISEKDQSEDVIIALKVRKDQLHDTNELIEIILRKITSINSCINIENTKLFIFFKQESIRPIPLSTTPRENIDNSSLDLFDNTSLIMDYLSGREKLYIRALV